MSAAHLLTSSPGRTAARRLTPTALGWLIAWPLLPGLSIWELALVAIVLGPTDGALGLAAISNPGVPAVVREGLNVESGLNDGMALPFFVLALAAAVETSEGGQGPLEVFLRGLVLTSAGTWSPTAC